MSSIRALAPPPESCLEFCRRCALRVAMPSPMFSPAAQYVALPSEPLHDLGSIGPFICEVRVLVRPSIFAGALV